MSNIRAQKEIVESKKKVKELFLLYLGVRKGETKWVNKMDIEFKFRKKKSGKIYIQFLLKPYFFISMLK